MPPWIAGYFLNPAVLLPGAALLAAPLIIHLINRMRFRRVKFAAMEFLLASQQKNRRRLLLEQLLLLLLRMAAVLALVALIARPIIDPQQLSLFQGQKAHHVVLLDDSGSMRDHWGETSAFVSGLDVIRKIAAEGARRPGTQTLTLLLLSKPDQAVLPPFRSLDPALVSELEVKLKNLSCSHRALDIAAGVEEARKLLIDQPGASRNLHLVSDFRRHDWEDEAALPAALREVHAARIAINLIRTVPQQHANLGITDLTGDVDVAAANVPLRLKLTVRNFGTEVAKSVRVAVLADGKKLPVSIVIESLDAGRDTSREFDVVFPTTGPHDVRVVLPADALEQDNERFLALSIPESNPVLIVEGDSAASEAFYLHDALAPIPGITGFLPTVESPEYLRRHPLDRFQSIFLLNVADLPPDSVRALEEYVSAGGGLVWYLGEQVRPAFYNDKLYQAGKGLFPLRLGSVAELLVDETNPAPDLAFEQHPAFRVFTGQENPFIESVKVTRYFTAARDWQPDSGIRVIASLRNKAPLFLEHRFGKGTVITCLTNCGTGWNNWPRNPSFVIMQLELEKAVARSQHTLDRRTVGEPIAIALDAAVYTPQVELRLPDGTTERQTAVIRTPDGSPPPPGSPAPQGAAGSTSADAVKPQFMDEFRKTDMPGIYAMALKRLDGSEDLQRFAYNVPMAENLLQLTTSERLRERVGSDVKMSIQEVGSFDWIYGEQAGQEIHDYVLMLLLGVLLFEQLLAMKMSYHPRAAGVQA